MKAAGPKQRDSEPAMGILRHNSRKCHMGISPVCMMMTRARMWAIPAPVSPSSPQAEEAGKTGLQYSRADSVVT